MKTKKTVLVTLLLCGLVAGWFPDAGAAPAWYMCTVDMAGPFGTTAASSSRVYLTDTATDPAWAGSKQFVITTTRAKEYLAVALTAVASGKKVKINSDLSSESPTISAIYVVNE